MKQLSQNLRSGKLDVDDMPSPTIQPGQVLVQTAYSLISAGTERTKIETGRKSLLGKALARPDQVRQVMQSVKQIGVGATYKKVMTRLDARSPLGYSATGIVLQVGDGVDEFRPGDWVACGGASAAHADIISVPRNLCVPVPQGVALDAAAFTTLGAIALQGIRQADLRLGECTVVLGLGLLGQLSVQMLKAAGCGVIGYDLNPDRCMLALQLGADAAVESEDALISSLAQITESRGADAVIVTAGTSSNRPVELAGELCRDKGRVVVVGAVGLTIPREPYYNKELELRLSRSYGPGRYDPTYEEKGLDYPYGYVRWTERRNMAAFLSLVAQGKVDVTLLITHRFKLEQAEEAYALISGAIQEPYLGVLFEYPQTFVGVERRVEIAPVREKTPGQLEIGVIGAGNFAQSMLLPHLKNNKQVILRSVATLSPLQSRDVAERFGFSFAASNHEELLMDPEIRAVIIATRHDSHADLAIQALQAGKAVHLEKPLALTLEQLDRVVAAYQQHTIVASVQSPISNLPSPFLMVGFNRRFAPMIRAAANFFAKRHEPLAMLYRINAGYIPLDHWTQDLEQGGGRIVGEVCHFVDLFQFFAGAQVQSVYAQALPNQGKYRDDNLTININLTDGSVGTILYVANGDKALSKEYVEIFSEGKVAIIDDYRCLTLVSGGRKKVSRNAGQDKGHKKEMIAWVDAIREGQAEPVPFFDAVAATKASFAVLRSLAEGQVVRIENV